MKLVEALPAGGQVAIADDPLAPLGMVVYDNSLVADDLLRQCAEELIARGLRLGGVVQSNQRCEGRRKCDMYLRDLLSGEEVLISLDRGNGARGCRLDPDAFQRINHWAARALSEGVDLLFLNKFGKEEAQGRGFRDVMAETLICGVPVLAGVSGLNLPDFLAFAGDVGTRIEPNRDSVLRWCMAAVESRA